MPRLGGNELAEHHRLPAEEPRALVPWEKVDELVLEDAGTARFEHHHREAGADLRLKFIEDAAKVAAVSARAKVIVFASRRGDQKEREEFTGRLERLRAAARDVAPWLWLDVPWDFGPGGQWLPAYATIR